MIAAKPVFRCLGMIGALMLVWLSTGCMPQPAAPRSEYAILYEFNGTAQMRRSVTWIEFSHTADKITENSVSDLVKHLGGKDDDLAADWAFTRVLSERGWSLVTIDRNESTVTTYYSRPAR